MSSLESSMAAAVGDGEDGVRGLDSGQIGLIPSVGEVLATRRSFQCARLLAGRSRAATIRRRSSARVWCRAEKQRESERET